MEPYHVLVETQQRTHQMHPAVSDIVGSEKRLLIGDINQYKIQQQMKHVIL